MSGVMRCWRLFLLMLVPGMGGGLLVAGIVTLLMTETYESEAIIEVKPLGSEVEALNGNGSPEYLTNSIEVLGGHEMLGKVVDALQLDRKWKEDRRLAVEHLKEAVSVQLLRD